MKYKIYEIYYPSVLQSIDDSGYHPVIVSGYALKEVNVDIVFRDEHATFELAVEEIKKNADSLEGKSLTILPIIKIDYQGKLRE